MTWPRSWTRAAPIEFYSEKALTCGGANAQGRQLEATELFDVRRHRHARQGGDIAIVRTDTIVRDDVAQELDSRGSDRVLFGESSYLWGRKRARKAARVATQLMGVV